MTSYHIFIFPLAFLYLSVMFRRIYPRIVRRRLTILQDAAMLRNLKDAINFFNETMAARPERDGLAAESAVWEGRRHLYPALWIDHSVDPADTTTAAPFFSLPETRFPKNDEGILAGKIMQCLVPLDLDNPVYQTLILEGAGSPADLVPCFGIPKSEDGGAPAYTLTLDDILRLAPPDPERAGLMPKFKKSAARIRELTPFAFKISVPDMQGPFNLVHAMIGDEAFTAPYTDPEKFRKLMQRITDLWIAARDLLVSWIGKERLRPGAAVPRVCECSVNMVSEAFYKEHILQHDLKLAKHFGRLGIHPCSGIHVFSVTLENLPVAATEAGMMLSKMAAPVISVRHGLKLIGDRPIVLRVGEELPANRQEAFKIVADHIDLSLENPRLSVGGYSGLWCKKDHPMIRGLHLELDRYWTAKSGGIGGNTVHAK